MPKNSSAEQGTYTVTHGGHRVTIPNLTDGDSYNHAWKPAILGLAQLLRAVHLLGPQAERDVARQMVPGLEKVASSSTRLQPGSPRKQVKQEDQGDEESKKSTQAESDAETILASAIRGSVAKSVMQEATEEMKMDNKVWKSCDYYEFFEAHFDVIPKTLQDYKNDYNAATRAMCETTELGQAQKAEQYLRTVGDLFIHINEGGGNISMAEFVEDVYQPFTGTFRHHTIPVLQKNKAGTLKPREVTALKKAVKAEAKRMIKAQNKKAPEASFFGKQRGGQAGGKNKNGNKQGVRNRAKCRNFEKNGTCKFGDKCKYNHALPGLCPWQVQVWR